MDSHRKKLKKTYADFEQFRREFEVPQELIDSLIREGERQNVKPKDEEELQRALPLLSLQLKALIARDLWDMSEYYALMNEDSEIVKKALEVMENEE